MGMTVQDLKPGDTVYFLQDYNWNSMPVVQVNRNTVTIRYAVFSGNTLQWEYFDMNKRIDKCAHPKEKVCVVWERWKGVNGRGGYRVDRDLYPDKMVDAEKVDYQHVSTRKGSGRVEEAICPFPDKVK
jgi:hypothetical protein